ncbi:hypothetical protein LHV13_04455 [Ferrovum sp. PN-J185]|uniref:PP0621 family protein n=1 Tax=Ferrovum sp. PN-J185 TaxID=1356306 RepID=UPI001E4B4B01|nr:PP0621 family protein [Ferrovum sp. PN-J185]MCC6068428.1 hypothetical protein [Ferrovum sp. PN-J185]MDE1891534.1 hypothetical protein [Betaproteobacteria bacterium]MDE2055868.1 hypothetical protein [Betaproteobacteria bacterium]
MMKLLLWLAVIYFATKYVLPIWQKHQATLKKSQESPIEHTEDMVRCAKCGVFVVRNEAIASRGRYYCSLAHKQQDQTGA